MPRSRVAEDDGTGDGWWAIRRRHRRCARAALLLAAGCTLRAPNSRHTPARSHPSPQLACSDIFTECHAWARFACVQATAGGPSPAAPSALRTRLSASGPKYKANSDAYCLHCKPTLPQQTMPPHATTRRHTRPHALRRRHTPPRATLRVSCVSVVHRMRGAPARAVRVRARACACAYMRARHACAHEYFAPCWVPDFAVVCACMLGCK